jgi:hypothetical protein
VNEVAQKARSKAASVAMAVVIMAVPFALLLIEDKSKLRFGGFDLGQLIIFGCMGAAAGVLMQAFTKKKITSAPGQPSPPGKQLR